MRHSVPPSIPVIAERVNGTPSNTVDYLQVSSTRAAERGGDGRYTNGHRITVHGSVSRLFETVFVPRNGHTDDEFKQAIADERERMINHVMDRILRERISKPSLPAPAQ